MQVNEAFAAQFLSVKKELGLDRERNLAHEMRRRNVRYSIGSACIGGLAVYIVMELELN